MKFLPVGRRRDLFNALAAASMLLWGATVALWCWSYVEVDLFQLDIPPHFISSLEANGGILQLTFRQDLPEAAPVHVRIVRRVFSQPPWGGWGPPFEIVTSTPYGKWAHWIRVRAPFWAIFLVSGILPLWWLIKTVAQSELRREGCCPHCGYDLRATPERCPECGAEIVGSAQKS